MVVNTIVLFYFISGHTARGTLPQPGMELSPPAVEAQSLQHWTTREVQYWFVGVFFQSVEGASELGNLWRCRDNGTWKGDGNSHILCPLYLFH